MFRNFQTKFSQGVLVRKIDFSEIFQSSRQSDQHIVEGYQSKVNRSNKYLRSKSKSTTGSFNYEHFNQTD
jgi:hypothetical protein